MADANDMDLVREFARHNSETAFAELVRRHINLVYSVALRFTTNPGDAEEVAQVVFIILVRKAAGLPDRTVLTGWLYETTRFTATRLLRTRARRQAHEQEAFMQSTLDQSGDNLVWCQVAPHLEAAMSRLGESDRTLLALRFYENKTGAEAAALMGIGAETAHKRTARALEKLRTFFHKRGIDSTAASIAEQISAHSVQAAPVALAKTVTAVAITKGSIASASTLTLVKEIMKTMTRIKLKFAMGVTTAILLAGGAVTVTLSGATTNNDDLSPTEIVKQVQDKYASLSSYSDTGKTIVEMGNIKASTTFDIRLGRSGVYRVEWAQMTAGRTVKGAAWFAGDGDFLQIEGPGSFKYSKMQTRQETLNAASGLSGMVAQAIPTLFFNESGSNFLSTSFLKQNDEKIGGTECYVLTRNITPYKTTFWIGQKDSLVHQIKREVDNTDNSPAFTPMSDSSIKETLQKMNEPVTPEAVAKMKSDMEQLQKKAQKLQQLHSIQSAISIETHENISVNKTMSKAARF
jgi:RNA polymerase sigma factor (sigma-70 family)